MAPHAYDPFPKYLQIREIILRSLAACKIGDLLSTEVELSRQFGVSRLTIRRALQTLEADGTIRRRAGSGTWLAKAPSPSVDKRFTGPVEDFASLGVTLSARLVHQGSADGPADIISALKLRPKARLFEVRRLRLMDDIPLLVLDAYFPLTLGRDVVRRNRNGGLFVPTLREIRGEGVIEQYQTIEATVADSLFASLLAVELGAAILIVNRIFIDAADVPVVYFRTRFRADRYYYTVKLPLPRLQGK